MWWWAWGAGSGGVVTGTEADNAPSLWSGGVRWGDPDAPFGDGTDAYWGSPALPTRYGRPRLSVAIAGHLVLEQLQSATWGLGRPDWLSNLASTSASFSFVDVPIAEPNDPIVIGLMSDSTEYHSEALWVGRVDDVSTRRDLDGKVWSTISATDVIGVLGQAKAPAALPAGYTLKTLVERLAADAGLAVDVETDPLVTLPTLGAVTGFDGSVLDLINRAERSSNALLFLRGSGRLYAAMRDATGASSVRVVGLDGPNSPSGWSTSRSLRNVVTRWQLGDGDLWATDTAATTLDDYGDHTFSATDLLISDPAPYANLIGSDVMARPRDIVTDATFPISALDQDVLYLDPLDRLVEDGTNWQAMSVQHSVAPTVLEDGKVSAYGEWRVSVAADATQEALAGAPDPGPVDPPALNTVSQDYTSTKAATVERQADGTFTGTSTGPILVGYFSDTKSVYRGVIEWAVVPPANAVGVVSAYVDLYTAGETDDGRVSIRYARDPWSEGTVDWPGPHTHTDGERRVDVPSSGNRRLRVSITDIARRWFEHGNNGITLWSVNESSASRRATFHSDDASDPDDRPQLHIVWEVVS